MTIVNTPLGQYFPSGRRPALLLLVTLSAMIAVGLLAAQQSLLAVGVAAVALLTLAFIIWPAAPTLTVVFILYTNAAAVAVQFHGVPFIVGAAVPLLLVLPLAHYLILRGQKLIFYPVLPLLLLFLAIQMLGALFSVNLSKALSNLITFLTEGLALYFLITNVVRTSETLRRVIWVLLLAGTLMGGLSLYQQVTQTYDQNYAGFGQVSQAAFATGEETLLGAVEQPRLAGPIGEQNRYAQILLMLVPLGLFQFWGERSKRLKALAAVATGFTALGAALTFSRGAAIGFVLMMVIMTFLRYIKLYQAVIIGIGVALLLQVVPQFGARLTSLDVLLEMASPDSEASLSQADGSTRSRLTEMAAAGLVFIDHPLVGVGPGMFRYYYQEYADRVSLLMRNTARQPHSLFPGLAAETGALGLVCFVAILFVTLRNLARTRKRWMQDRPDLANMAAGFMLAIISYLTTGLFLHYGYIRFFWLIMALAGVASHVTTTDMLTNQANSVEG